MMDVWVGGWMDGWIMNAGQMFGWIDDGWVSEWMRLDGRMGWMDDGWLDGWLSG